MGEMGGDVADGIFWLTIILSFLLMGALTGHFWVSLLVTFLLALVNLLPYFLDDKDF